MQGIQRARAFKYERPHARALRETAAWRSCNSRTGANSGRSAIALPAMVAVCKKDLGFREVAPAMQRPNLAMP